jgi:hypothetical protein
VSRSEPRGAVGLRGEGGWVLAEGDRQPRRQAAVGAQAAVSVQGNELRAETERSGETLGAGARERRRELV